MGKTVYSIVLDDDVVRGIDIMASRQGTSRSNMINRILAQHISLPTAETMLNDIYRTMDEIFRGHSSLSLRVPAGGSMINMRSALRYKYNPSVKYSVEIYEKSNYIGLLKVSLRTQNNVLITILNEFFKIWSELECEYTYLNEKEFSYSGGKYSRLLRTNSSSNHQKYGNYIANYVDLLDKCMKTYFDGYSLSPYSAALSVKQIYITSISKQNYTI